MQADRPAHAPDLSPAGRTGFEVRDFNFGTRLQPARVVEAEDCDPLKGLNVNSGSSLGVLVRVAVFLVGSYGIIALSISSLKDPRSRGFYRAFAFEALLALFLVNLTAWLKDPFGFLQWISWTLLTVSAVVAIFGFSHLRRRGRPSGPIESTTVLVTTGMYRLIRHPLYASLLYLGWGIFLKRLTPLSTALAAAATLALYLTARTEERENVDKFGESYVDYMAKTKRFIPFVF